jgi:hypothetical protein
MLGVRRGDKYIILPHSVGSYVLPEFDWKTTGYHAS